MRTVLSILIGLVIFTIGYKFGEWHNMYGLIKFAARVEGKSFEEYLKEHTDD